MSTARKPKPPCDVCGDVGAVVLPSREGPVKRFPCPQCAPMVNMERIVSLAASTTLQRKYLDDESYRAHIRLELADALTKTLINAKHARFMEREPDRNGDVLVSCYIEVVGPATAPRLEARIAERQRELADAWAKQAISNIIELPPVVADAMSVQVFKADVVDCIHKAIDQAIAARVEKPFDQPEG
jgi:hypothetical protein